MKELRHTASRNANLLAGSAVVLALVSACAEPQPKPIEMMVEVPLAPEKPVPFGVPV